MEIVGTMIIRQSRKDTVFGGTFEPIVVNLTEDDAVELSPEQYTLSRKVVGVGIEG